MKILTSDEIWGKVEDIVRSSNNSIKIASAWIKGSHFRSLVNHIKNKKGKSSITVEIIIRASEFRDLSITDNDIFRQLKDIGAKIYLSNRLHAKFIIADDLKAIVGSANFTDSGLSEIHTGNIEACVYYERNNNSKSHNNEIDKLINYFETIKKDHTVKEYNNIIGFTLNPTKTDSFEFILIEDDVEIQSYVELKMNDSKIVIGKIDTIYNYDAGFFANPFTSSESKIFSSFDDFKKLFLNDYDKDWKRAAVIAYLNENKQNVRIATVKVIGVIDKDKSSKLDILRTPLEVGKAVYKADKDTISKLFRVNFSGEEIKRPIRVGHMKDTDIDVFIDANEVLSKHMMIVGTTGSGKSYFTTKLISEFATKCEDLNIIIFDPHGEYKSKLKELSSFIKELEFEDSIIHAFSEETIEFFKEAGLSNILSSNSNTARTIKDTINTYIKPYLMFTGLRNKSLKEIIEEISEKINTEDEKSKKNNNKGDNNQDDNNNSKNIKNYFNAYGEELNNQAKIINGIIESIENKEGKKILILNFKNITYPETRVNIAGLIMQHIFNQHKNQHKSAGSNCKRLIVLEEAHSFVPESKYGDTSSGKDNLALTMARKIASEGRKFGIGLIAITQRPAQVSKYILSQMNTQALFRTINSNDLDTLSITIEHAGEDIIRLIPLLFTGSCVISGIAIPFPVLVDVK